MNAPGPTAPTRRRRRLAILLAIGAALLFAAWAFRYFWLVLPMGSGPAGPPVAREAFEQPWTTRKVLLVGIGDSVTAGWGVPQTHSYVGRLAKNPSDEFPEMAGLCLSTVLPNLEVKNIAVSGSTSFHHLDQIREHLSVQDADTFGLIVMTSGGNDLIHNYGRTPPHEGAAYGATWDEAQPWIANYETRLKDLFELIRERFPGGCQIFVADIYDPTDGRGTPSFTWLPPWPDGLRIHRAYNDTLRRGAAEHAVHVVPMHDAFLGHGIHCRKFWNAHYRRDDPCYWYAPNLEDPNLRGYDAIRRLFLNEIVRFADELK